MFQANGTTIIGTSELRNLGTKALAALTHGEVILTQRGKPVGVIQGYAEYLEKEKMIEEFEDMVLGHLAKERLQKGKMFSSDEFSALLTSEK